MKPTRTNNFDLLRLLLAVLVVRCHAGLVGYPFRWTEDTYFMGGLSAVQCFFVISGYLIFRSWESKPVLSSFAEKRARRILPAYVFVVVLCTLGLSLLSTHGVADYFADSAVYRYLFSNLAFVGFLQNTLPGVFESNVDQYVNGPLWTIKIEVMFYISVPIIAYLAGKINRVTLFAVLYVGGVVWNLGFNYLGEHFQQRGYHRIAEQLPGQMAFFISGAAMHYYERFFTRHIKAAVIFSIGAVAGYFAYWPELFAMVYPMALAVLVIGFATRFAYLGNFGRFGDFSYGIYIYHYPIFQTLTALELPLRPATSFALGVTLSVIASVLSWHLLESRWLLKSSHYIKASHQANDPT
ncbi:acyltransferase family protein [Stieleria varia]|uniref:Acyltransferase family protein n=1 Tax=Stieleria varia TaxID=2528005 RepID=A0A5C6A0K3_9BACT|nr:acyltransferase [Stieleria varia]TWT92728.1 Acyltransferase family protein [Stieleria varia]